MSETTPFIPTVGRSDELFPKLTAAQIARIAALGHVRSIERGEVLVEVGASEVPFFMVVSGELEVVRPSGTTETLITSHGPAQFTREVNIISGRRALLQARVSQSGEVIELSREHMLALVHADADLSEILILAFILRRVNLFAYGLGDVVLLGSSHSAGTLRIKGFLTRNTHPYSYIDLDRDADVQTLLDRFQLIATDVPVVISRVTAGPRHPPTPPIPT